MQVTLMNRKTALVVIVAVIAAIVVMIYLLIKFGIIHGKTSTTTTSTSTATSTTTTTTPPTTTPPSSSSNVTAKNVQVLYYTIYEPKYEILNGTLYLPSQAGTTINVLQCTDIYINGIANPNQQVTLTIYGPSGGVVYTTTTTANSSGFFNINLYSSQLSSILIPNAQYKFVFSLGQNYYFYAAVVQSPVAPCPGNRPVVVVEYTYNGQSNTIVLPSQGGTTIQFDYGTDIYIYGYINCYSLGSCGIPPGYSVGVMVTPAGSNISGTWFGTNFVDAFGYYTVKVPTTQLIPGVKYEFIFELGANFVFYGTPVQQSSSPSVYVQYCDNGIFNVLALPSQAGTSIDFSLNTNLKIIGYAQPNQQVTLNVYSPWGSLAYSTSTTAGSDGSFTMTISSSYLLLNVQYKFVFSIGQNYYFYGTPVQGELCF